MRRVGPRDAALVAVCMAVDLLLSANFGPTLTPAEKLVILGYAPVGCLLLLWRRQQPLAVFLLATLHAVVGIAVVTGYRPFVACLVALYATARYGRRTDSYLAFGVALVPIAGAVQDEAVTLPADARVAGTVATALTYLLFFVVAWWLGRWRAAAQRRVATAAAQERQRLAGEMHDVVAHTVTVMMLYAAGARRAVHRDPSAAERALGAIEESGVAALGELRQLLDVLGAGPATGGQDDAVGVVEMVRGAGVHVDLAGAELLAGADEAVRRVGHRVVREALTNAARHAGPETRIEVRIAARGQQLEIEVRDTGRPGAAASPDGRAGTGRGLDGLRDRLRVLGGTLDAGRNPDGVGWFVRAVLPRTAARGGPAAT
ncbi:sensor histidine kinase [Phytohabitans rumicis]|uniref:histidine kinase n=1 Tax=Phytohabitans rumicis TaxID=1076125 RepID=A0A6V8KTV3_9ACTN|nr:histidine kinase [Phytohabitans rumicis]GFJ86880.1 two-component sensor histidine kinase [Phytohabitans rumicis]